MQKSNEPVDNIPEDDNPSHCLGSFEIFDVDKLLSEFEDHHIRCSADFPTEIGGLNTVNYRLTARAKIYVHPQFVREAVQIYKKLGIEPW